MIGYSAKDMADSFRIVRKNTLVIAEEIPEDKYNFKPAADVRSVAELLTHIAVAYTFQYQMHAVDRRSNMEGFDFPSLMRRMQAEEKQSRTKAQIIDLLHTSGEKWAGWVEGLSDDFLAEKVHFPKGAVPPSKTRFEMILSVKEHEMHHRGQLMLIERMLTIVPHLTREMQARMAASMAAQKS
jgi:uncharacterized damage-inducible protein DinB